jgi:hypothetical protein
MWQVVSGIGVLQVIDPSTINFSDIRDNYTAHMVLWRPVQPRDYWYP